MARPSSRKLLMPDPPAHSANHYPSYDSQPKLPASPSPSFYYGHHQRHHPGPRHTHYFVPKPQVPPYQAFSFPAIFNDVPDDIPTIGKSFNANNSGRRIRTVEANCSISEVPGYTKTVTGNIGDNANLTSRSSPKVEKLGEELKQDLLECIRASYLTPRSEDCNSQKLNFINL